MLMKITFKLNGKERTEEVKASEKGDAFLRRIGVFSIRNGCNGEGFCGSCAVVVNGRVINTCLLVAPQFDGKEVFTVEYYSKNRALSIVQASLIVPPR